MLLSSKELDFRETNKESVQVMFYYKIIEFLKDSMLQFVKSGVSRRRRRKKTENMVKGKFKEFINV